MGMAHLLVATGAGCRAFSDKGECAVEIAGHHVCALTPETDGRCIAVVNQKQIWRRGGNGEWSQIATSDIDLESLESIDGVMFGGGASEAALVRIPAGEQLGKRLTSFHQTPGRNEWVSHGPPLSMRAVTATSDRSVILTAVHVGGMPRSIDGGKSWSPTVPIEFDVHEVRAHQSNPNIVAAAAAVGLCVSNDAGITWSVLSDGIAGMTSLAVAVLDEEVLFSVQDGPFPKRSQVWRWRIGSDDRIEPVREGLPPWLSGKVDTAHISASSNNRAAIVDGGGNLWLSTSGSTGWERIATDLKDANGVLLL
jgi:hypothetical protein